MVALTSKTSYPVFQSGKSFTDMKLTLIMWPTGNAGNAHEPRSLVRLTLNHDCSHALIRGYSMRRLQAFFAFVLLAVSSSVSSAELILQPPGLEPGDKYRLLFLTSTERDGTSSRIESYNDFVQNTADAAPVVGAWDLDWKALLSTATVDARDNTQTAPEDESMPIYRVDGVLIANDYEQFYGIDLELSLNVTELDAVVTENTPIPNTSRGVVWTGTIGSGIASDTPLGSQWVTVGSLGPHQPAWFFSTTALSRSTLPIYAMSAPIVAVPEVSSSFLGCFAICIFVIYVQFRTSMSSMPSTL